MGLISDGITNVRGFELPVGIWSDGEDICVPRFVLIRWKSSLEDKFYQVYVNGEYAGTTDDRDQRQMVVSLPMSFLSSVCIEVFGVHAGEADIDFSGQLKSAGGVAGRVKIGLLREQKLPAGGKVQVYFDNGTGQIDYVNAVNYEPVWLWADWQDRGGFGMSVFGFSDFGRDWSAGVGFGRGSFGWGQFGVDADSICWISEQFEAGVYKFAVKVIDGEGNESEAVQAGEVMVLGSAKGAEDLDVISFDESANKLILKVT